VIFQVSLTVLDNLKDQLIKCSDDAEAITTVTQYLDSVGIGANCNKKRHQVFCV